MNISDLSYLDDVIKDVVGSRGVKVPDFLTPLDFNVNLLDVLNLELPQSPSAIVISSEPVESSTVCIGSGCFTRTIESDGTETHTFSPFPFFSGEAYVKAGG